MMDGTLERERPTRSRPPGMVAIYTERICKRLPRVAWLMHRPTMAALHAEVIIKILLSVTSLSLAHGSGTHITDHKPGSSILLLELSIIYSIALKVWLVQ